MSARRWAVQLGGAITIIMMQSGCSKVDEDVSIEDTGDDETIEQQVESEAKSLDEAADDAVKIMEEEISATSALPDTENKGAAD